MPSRSTLEKLATEILTELYDDVDEPEEIEVEQVHTVSATNTTAKTYAQSLQEDIDKETAPKSQNSLPSKKSLQTEMHLFETTNQKGDSLTKLEILKNIAPTSVACESAFGLAGNIITRSRARLTFISN